MRVSTNLIFSLLMKNYSLTVDKLTKTSKQVSSGKRYVDISTSPSDTSQILSLKRSISEMNDFLNNMNLAKNWLSTIDSILSKTEDFIQRVRELALASANDTQNDETREVLAKELEGILDELVDIGNTKSGDRYLFGGTKINVPPFANPPMNSVTMLSAPVNGVRVDTADTFLDLYQLSSGKYRIFISREGSSIKVSLVDEGGNIVQVDSNGSDDSAYGGNLLANFGLVKASNISGKYYGVFDTGRGLKVAFDGLDITNLENPIVIDVLYQRGGEVSYNGNQMIQNVKIGYTETVPVTLSGEDVFMASRRLLASQARFENLSEATTFSSLGIGNSSEYKIDGVDHFGYPVGSAFVVGTKPVDLTKITSSPISLSFYLNENGVISSYSITFSVADVSRGMAQVVDAIRNSIEASPLKGKVGVSNEGNHIVFHLLEPSDSYLFVKEDTTDLLGFADGIGAWGRNPVYVVKDSISAKGVVFSSSTTLTINTNHGMYNISIGPTKDIPIFTLMPTYMRFYSTITAGTTVSVNGNVWTAPSDITTLDDFVKAWNNESNWSGGYVPIGVVKEKGSSIRFVGLDGASSYLFSSTGDVLYKIGLAATSSDTSYNLVTPGDYKEFSALRIAYYIAKGSNYDINVYTDGFGNFVLEDTKGAFDIVFDDPTHKIMEGFASYYDGVNYVARSDNSTILDFIKFIEEVYNGNVRAFVYDGRIWIEDKKGGSSKLTLGFTPLSGTKSLFDRFFVAREGSGIDLFSVIKSLIDNLKENTPKRGVATVSNWNSQDLNEANATNIFKGTIGNFTGNYATTWKIKVNLIDSAGSILPDGYVANFDGINYKLLVTVYDSRNKEVATFVADSLDASYYVRDGLYLVLGKGQVKSGDFFTVSVGSGVEDLIGYLDNGIQRVLSGHTGVGANLKKIEMANTRYSLRVNEDTKGKASLEEVDLAGAITELSKAQLALQATLQTIVRLTGLSILDFLR